MSKNNILDVTGQTLSKTKPIQGFTQIDNAAILDQRLSFKARGILALLLSRPSDWQIYVNELTNRSEKDGRRAVQSGLKELSKLGYLELIPIYNNETGRFEGTFYKINEHLFLPRRTHFKPVCNSDRPESGQAEKQINPKTVDPQTDSLSNTNNSNKENSKTKQQQQKEKAPDATEALDIIFFTPQLIKDQQWRHHFLGQSIGPKCLLDDAKFNILLRHFQQTSLQQGRKYGTIADAKRHFANWYNANLGHNKLTEFIQVAKFHHKQVKSTLGEVLTKAGNIFHLFETRNCTNKEQVLGFREKLLKYRKQLSNLLPYLELESLQTATRNAVENIDLLFAQIERGRLAEQLGWYCAHNSQ